MCKQYNDGRENEEKIVELTKKQKEGVVDLTREVSL